MSRWILGDKFNTTFPHKGSIKTLWETRWEFACTKSIYPFHDGNVEDFEPVFEYLIQNNINDAYSDEYTNAFQPSAASLEKRAEEALAQGKTEEVSNLYKRAAVVYRISRFPYVSPSNLNSVKRAAFERQKKVYLKAASFWTPRITEVVIPHTRRAEGEADTIPIYLRIPEHASPSSPVPVVLLMTGLDGYRPDNTQRTQEIHSRGWATVVSEIPGTADCPAESSDPESADRLWSSVLDYMAGRPEFNMGKVVVWGLSAGGYYAIRAAYTHAEQLRGCIAHGAGSHYFLDQEWLSKVNDHEYPFDITPAWAEKYGYKNVDQFTQEAQKKFSLVETNVVQSPSCRLLLLNGVNDGVTPIEDSMILFNYGSPKEARFAAGLPHMGYPDTLSVAYNWLEEVLA